MLEGIPYICRVDCGAALFDDRVGPGHLRGHVEDDVVLVPLVHDVFGVEL